MSALPVIAEGKKGTALPLDPRTFSRALSCVHCGLCLPACPTYTQTGHEADSPRGRIQLMRGLAEGTIEATDSVRQHLDLCLDCRACETACPSGVIYHELIEETRARLGEESRLKLVDRLMRWMFFHVFTHPTRLKMALLPARLMQKIGLYGVLRKMGAFKLLPLQLQKMEQMLPARGRVWPAGLRLETESMGREHGRDARDTSRVVFFQGCIGSVMFDDVNQQAVDLLRACGADVWSPGELGCCGAIHHHNGAHGPAMAMARRNIDAVTGADGALPDFIATNIAGCGAMLREYDFLLRDDAEYAEKAKTFVGRVRDISEVLAALGVEKLFKHRVEETVTYHDACHLAHAQKVVAAPRGLLSAIAGVTLVPLPESDMCCGAAGTYNLTQPKMAMDLAARKVRHIEATGAKVCATGNVGCAMHIASEASARGVRVEVVHPVTLMHRAVFGIKAEG